MALLGDLLQWVAVTATEVVASAGYVGIFALMAMESMFFPVPSEAVMPPAGILVAEGRLDLWGVVAASTLGSLAGSLLSYAIGRFGAEPLVRRYGRWFLLNPHHIDQAHAFFEKRGALAVFLARFVPGVRHVSSIPAGIARMSLGPFVLATLLGATAWNMLLLWAGITLGHNWERVLPLFEYAEVVAIALVLVAVAWWLWQRRRRTRSLEDAGVIVPAREDD